jgi:hypothetical protein
MNRVLGDLGGLRQTQAESDRAREEETHVMREGLARSEERVYKAFKQQLTEETAGLRGQQ